MGISNDRKTESINSFRSAISKTEKALIQMKRIESNTTLIEKRLIALRAGLAVLHHTWNQIPLGFTRNELAEARAVLTGLLPSMEKLYAVSKNPSPQRTLLARRITAVGLAVQAIDETAGETHLS